MSYKKNYLENTRPKLKKTFDYKNSHQIPKIEKIVLNMGVGEAVYDSKVIQNAVNDLTMISGQKPVVTHAKKSVASYKLREGMKIGCKVTLRRDRMYHFIERLVMIALPRIKDFKGFSKKSFDRNGNFSFGIKEQTVFPGLSYDKVDSVRGLDITFVTNVKDINAAKELLMSFNMPFYN